MQEYCSGKCPDHDDVLECVQAARDNMYDDLLNTNLIVADDATVGMIVAKPVDEKIYLRSIYIVENSRNRGIGTYVIKHTLDSNNYVYLYVYKSNKRAVSLYERLGFKVLSDNGFICKMIYRKGDQ